MGLWNTAHGLEECLILSFRSGRGRLGEHLTDFYEELSEETSTVLQTLKTGKMSIDEPQVLTWKH